MVWVRVSLAVNKVRDRGQNGNKLSEIGVSNAKMHLKIEPTLIFQPVEHQRW
jgi:hypothetical protein